MTALWVRPPPTPHIHSTHPPPPPHTVHSLWFACVCFFN